MLVLADMTGYIQGAIDAGHTPAVGVITDFVDEKLTDFIKEVITEVSSSVICNALC